MLIRLSWSKSKHVMRWILFDAGMVDGTERSGYLMFMSWTLVFF